MNVPLALHMARTKDLSALLPWGNSISLIRLVEYFSRRVHRTDSNGSYMLDIYAESKSAQDLNLNLRLVGGWRAPPAKTKAKGKGKGKDDPDPAPPSIQAERRRGVPELLLGFPVAQAPKMLRFLFFIESRVVVWEFDLVASHLRELRQLAERHGIACDALASYVKDETSVRNLRRELAVQLGVRDADIKQLMNMLGYGSSGSSWEVDHGVEMPEQSKQTRFIAKMVCARVWEAAGAKLRKHCEQRDRPQLTCLSIQCQIGERQSLDLVEQAIAQIDGAAVGGFINDALLAYGMRPASAGMVKQQMIEQDTLVSITHVSMSTQDYKTFVEQKLGYALDWTPLSESFVQAELEAMEFISWLHPPPGHVDPKRGGRPFLAAARGVAPFIVYYQNRLTKQTEFFDVNAGIWKEMGGEFMLAGDELNKVLCERMLTYRMEIHEVNGKRKLCPVANTPHPLLKDLSCLNSIASLLKTINKQFDEPLGKSDAIRKMLVFAGGTTVDFTQPFNKQVRAALASDRNNRSSPWRFREPANEQSNVIRRQLGADLSKFLMTLQVTADTTCDDIVNEFGDRFIDLMKGGHDPMFQHFYYEPAGGILDGCEPKNGLGDAIYSLRRDIGSATGTRAGFEEYMIEWGPLGNNGKGQKSSLRETVLGPCDRTNCSGYVARGPREVGVLPGGRGRRL